ncbi:MAG: ammonia-forming cytochrome c nitrite reductase subunit c552 [Thermoproteota archaeon]
MSRAGISGTTLAVFVVLLIIVGAAAFVAGRLAKETVTMTVKPEPVTTTQTVTETVRETETVTRTLALTTTETVTGTVTTTVTQAVDVSSIVEEAIGELFFKAIMLHYDNPETPDIEGVNVNPLFGCQGCHFGPEAAEKMEQWGRSGHGGYLLEVKERDPAGAVTEEEAPAWVHYDFKESGWAVCQRCHTATGARNFFINPAGYSPENNTFPLFGQQKELLYCWVCHKVPGVEADTYELRNPGPLKVTAPYSEEEKQALAGRLEAVPDLGPANLCVACHSGRSAGAKIKLAEDIKRHFGAFNSHYLAAGGVLYGFIGYEYDGRSYMTYSPHAAIRGSCVACHMPDADHTFEPLVRDEGGKIVDIKAYDKVCSLCHAQSKEELIALIEQREKGFRASLKVIEQLLAAKGIYFDIHVYPYFYPSPDPAQHRGPPTAFTDWPDKDTLGAAFILNLLAHEPGAFVHNPTYTKQLIYDAIDYLDDGQLNDSVMNTVTDPDARAYLEGAR